MSRKRKTSDGSKKSPVSTIHFSAHWQATNIYTRNYFLEALDFFKVHDCSTFVQKLKEQVSPLYSIPATKIIFYFLTSVSVETLKNRASTLKSEDRSLFHRCAYITNLLLRKNIDPCRKDTAALIWPNLKIPLTMGEVLFYWFVLQYDIGNYYMEHERELEQMFFLDRQGRSRETKMVLKKVSCQ